MRRLRPLLHSLQQPLQWVQSLRPLPRNDHGHAGADLCAGHDDCAGYNGDTGDSRPADHPGPARPHALAPTQAKRTHPQLPPGVDPRQGAMDILTIRPGEGYFYSGLAAVSDVVHSMTYGGGSR